MRSVRGVLDVCGGILLIAGTMIGVGMLAIPVATGPAGFIPATVLYLACWVFMLCTGLLMLEVCLWMPKESNLISMSQKLLGPLGKTACWVLYLFLFFAISVAHIASGGELVDYALGHRLPFWLNAIIYTALCALVVFAGIKVVEWGNLFLMAGIILSFFSFLVLTVGKVELPLLAHMEWAKAWGALPILFTAFTYQVIIPTLVDFFKRDVQKVRLCIFVGTSIPLVIYLIWEGVILGSVPPALLEHAAANGQTAVIPLREMTHHPEIFQVGQFFSFFTLTASFLALALSYVDFLADGFKVRKSQHHWNALLCLLVFIPPLIAVFLYQNVFLIALDYAGGISCAILFGLYPVLMAWKGRYRLRIDPATRQLPGGKPVLWALLAFLALELGVRAVDF